MLEKRFGRGVLEHGLPGADERTRAISTGIVSLDRALGVGGIPCGRITEVFGDVGSGKTTVALHLVAQAQKYGTVAFVSADHSLDADWATRCGVRYEDLYISHPDTQEQALEVTEALVRSEQLNLIVIDSIDALSPRREIEGEVGESHPALHERIMRQALRKLIGPLAVSNTAALLTSYYPVVAPDSYEAISREHSSVAYFSSVRLRLDKLALLANCDIEGLFVSALILKNRLAPPFKAARFGLLHSGHIIDEIAMADMAPLWLDPGFARDPLKSLLWSMVSRAEDDDP